MILAKQAHNHGRRAGVSGVRVFVDCYNDMMTIRMLRSDDSEILDADEVAIIANDFLALGGDGIFEPVTPKGGFDFGNRKPLVRDVLIEWFRAQETRMNAANFMSDNKPRWNLPKNLPEPCTLPTLK